MFSTHSVQYDEEPSSSLQYSDNKVCSMMYCYFIPSITFSYHRMEPLNEVPDRFDSYSKRIRVLSIHDHSSKEIAPMTVLTVAVRLERICLLPCLRCLSLGGARMEQAELLFLLSPQLSLTFAALDTLCKTSRLLTALQSPRKPSSNFVKFQICNTLY